MTPPQDSVSDVERLRAMLADLHYATLGIATPAESGLDAARDQVSAYFAGVPINKIGENAKVSDSTVYKHTFYGILNAQGDFWTPLAFESEQAATDHIVRFWGGDHTDKAKQCLRTHSIVPVRIQLSAIRRLSTNTDKGVSNGR